MVLLLQTGNIMADVNPDSMQHEPAHDETYSKTCLTSKDSDQPVHPPSMARVLVYPYLDSLEAVEGTCDQQRLIRLCRYTG